MTGTVTEKGGRSGSWLRIIGWGFAAALILTPAVAMLLGGDVDWSPADFIFAIIMIGGVGLVLELTVWLSSSLAYRAGVAAALGGTFLTIWINLAVGIVGSEDNPVNLIFFGVLLVGFLAVAIAQFSPRGMARAMYATLAAQLLAGAAVLVMAWDGPDWRGAVDIVGITGFFCVFWLLAAGLFHKAARDQAA